MEYSCIDIQNKKLNILYFPDKISFDGKYKMNLVSKMSTKLVYKRNYFDECELDAETTSRWELKITDIINDLKYKYKLPDISPYLDQSYFIKSYSDEDLVPNNFFHYLDDIFIVSYSHCFLIIDCKINDIVICCKCTILHFDPELRILIIKNLNEICFISKSENRNIRNFMKNSEWQRLSIKDKYSINDGKLLYVPLLMMSDVKKFLIKKGFNIPKFEDMKKSLFGPFPNLDINVHFSDGKVVMKYSDLIQMDSEFINSQLENDLDLHISNFKIQDYLDYNLNLIDFLDCRSFSYWKKILLYHFKKEFLV